jgi:hypothetical protein
MRLLTMLLLLLLLLLLPPPLLHARTGNSGSPSGLLAS